MMTQTNTVNRLASLALFAGLAAAAPALAADFNGDGFADLAIGVPGEGFNNLSAAGIVQIFYGTTNGISITAKPDQVFHQDTPGVNQTAESGDKFGSVLATGDFNGDGYDDLAIGSPEEDIMSGGFNRDKAGVVNILYGSANGLTSANDQDFVQGFNGVPGTAEANDRFGAALAAGDFNNDGYCDLAIGIPGDRANNVFGAGAVQIMHGHPGGLFPAKYLHQDSPGMLDSCENNDGFGAALAAADFGDDGFCDLAIGVPGEDVSINGGFPVQNCGMVQVVYGNSNGLSIANQVWNQGVNGLLGATHANERMGFTLAAGHRKAMKNQFVNFPAEAYLAIGIAADGDSPAKSGSVIILRANMGTDRLVATNNQLLTLDLIPGFTPPAVTDSFGAALVMADFGKNNVAMDPKLDLAIAAPGAAVPASEGGLAIAGAGCVFVVYDVGFELNPNKVERFAQGALGGLGETPETADNFGASLAAANFGKGIFADLAVGVPGEDTTLSNVGAVHVLYSAGNPGLETAGHQFFTQNTPEVEDQAEASDAFGSALR